MCLSATLAAGRGHAQTRARPVEPAEPPRRLQIFAPPYYRIERLPPDIRQVFRDYRDELARYLEPDPPTLHDASPRAAVISLLRLNSPRGQRQLLFMGVGRSSYCGSAGCPIYLFERIGRRWNMIESAHGGVELLGIWNDGYPTFLANDSLVSGWFHWWEQGRYHAACMPPTEGECPELNWMGMPDIFRDPAGRR